MNKKFTYKEWFTFIFQLDKLKKIGCYMLSIQVLSVIFSVIVGSFFYDNGDIGLNNYYYSFIKIRFFMILIFSMFVVKGIFSQAKEFNSKFYSFVTSNKQLKGGLDFAFAYSFYGSYFFALIFIMLWFIGALIFMAIMFILSIKNMVILSAGDFSWNCFILSILNKYEFGFFIGLLFSYYCIGFLICYMKYNKQYMHVE